MGLPSGDPTQSAAFYADFATSREILRAVLDSLRRERVGGSEKYLMSAETDSAKRAHKGILELQRSVGTMIQPKTGVVTLKVTTKSATLSQRIAALVITQLNQFNLSNRQGQAGAERRFVERRLNEVRDSLRRAENELSEFLRTNRAFGGAADLRMREARLQREVDLRQQMYATLSQSLEEARIDEVRDTPLLSTIETPEIPVLPDSRNPLLWMFLSGFFATAVVAWVLIFRQLFNPNDDVPVRVAASDDR
jgi:uncharacterized protein involved in exopolysaccharide biosynthesis